MVDRRDVLKRTGALGTIGLAGIAGCLGDEGDDGDDGDDGNGNVSGGDGVSDDGGSDDESGDGDSDDGDSNDGNDGDSEGGDSDGENDGEDPLPETVEFLMSPSDPQEEMEAQYGPMADYLGDELGADVSLQYSNNYSAVIQSLGSGTGHIGEMGPFAAALGVRDDQLDIILQRYAYGGWTYASVLVTRDDTDIESVEDLEGRSIAFADRLSASGTLVPLSMLSNAGLEIGAYPDGDGGADFDATFSSHAEAVAQLEAGTVDAAGCGLFAAVVDGDEEREEYFDWIEPIEKRAEIPRAPICVSPTLSDDGQEAIKQAFLDAPEEAYEGSEGADGEVYSLWFSDVREADADTYQPVVDIATELGIEADLLDG